MTLENINDFLANRTIGSSSHCYGSIVHMPFEGGVIETAGSDWTLTIDGKAVENSEEILDSEEVGKLVGMSMCRIRILSPNSCELVFWGGAVLRCVNAAHEGYEMGAEMFTIYRDDPDGSSWYCTLSAPFDKVEWLDATIGLHGPPPPMLTDEQIAAIDEEWKEGRREVTALREKSGRPSPVIRRRMKQTSSEG